ncbi:DUF2782 domain-containing protein [Salinicola rhizosphaerae]|uniref:DUF2782 domain-containing protein n=1 Tax=Salinicola rhizosphaerae TaxID=1443141 RepID=A0ABQ3EF67_9GAMM|nr:DUF2782 domain-containing protein [Salinicola rhizosphaerae]GHB32741.1 hypothetical protein GCM10009038_34560 [Salinicola rhizosphaerae]
MSRLKLAARRFVAALLALGALSPLALAQPAVQPEITSQRDAQHTIDEYRVNGELYAIRVSPRHGDGKSDEIYFLYDDDGDGDFKRVDAPSVPIPDWVQSER